MKKLTILTVTLLLTALVQLTAQPVQAEVSIPDDNLANAIRETLNLPTNAVITADAMRELTELDAPGKGIADLTGLEHAVNLTELNLGSIWVGVKLHRNPMISDVSPLAGLTQLRHLDLARTAVSDVSPLAGLTQLTYLDLALTAVSDVSPLAGLTQLTYLNLAITAVSDVSPLAGLTQLTVLSLTGTAVSDVSPLAGLTQLTELRLLQTDVSDVSPLAGLTQLTWLSLWDTHAFSDVSPLAGLTQLTYLDLGITAVLDVSPLANLTQLTWLSLLQTDVSDVSPLAGLTQLTVLRLDGTAVSDVSPLAGLTQLTELSLGGTTVSDVSPLAGLPQLTELSLGGTTVSDVSPLAGLPQLTELSLGGTAVSDVSPLAGLPQLTSLSLGGTAVSDVSPLAGLPQLTSLSLRETAVSDVSPLAGLPQLTSLSLHHTAVSDVSPLVNLTQLEFLGLDGCPLSYASFHTHIPAMLAKGIQVGFDNVAHPALLKTSGDRQEGTPGAMLKTPFVVEAMDEHGEPLVGVPIQFEMLHGGGILSAQTATTDAQGTAQVTLTLGAAAGINKVKASSEGIESWVLFTAVGTEEVPQLVADVNGDGIVNIQDLVLVAGRFGETGKNSADVNGDGVVNIQDLVLVAGAFGEGAAAPSARAVALSRLTVSDVEGWLNEARAVSSVGQDRPILTSFSPQTHILSGSGSGEPELQIGSASRPGRLSYLRGIAVLEQLLANFMPQETALLANYPNPFNPETWIPYQLANPAEVTVTIYAANGAVVRTLDLGHRRAGSYASRSRAAYWDGRNAQGEPVASGVYFYTLQAGDFSATRKMVIRK